MFLDNWIPAFAGMTSGVQSDQLILRKFACEELASQIPAHNFL